MHDADCSLLLEERLEEAGGSGRSEVLSRSARARITCFMLRSLLLIRG
jgi:hypothetical protein